MCQAHDASPYSYLGSELSDVVERIEAVTPMWFLDPQSVCPDGLHGNGRSLNKLRH